MRAAADQEVAAWVERRSKAALSHWNAFDLARRRLDRINAKDLKAGDGTDPSNPPPGQGEVDEVMSGFAKASPFGLLALSIASPLMPDSKGDQQQMQPATLSTDEAAAAMRAVVETRRAADATNTRTHENAHE